MEGTPARLEMLTSSIPVSQFLGAYSSRYTAAPTPMGTVKAAVSPMIQTVPNIAALSPACSGCREG